MENIWIEKKINANITKRIFKHYELGILGCGKSSAPFLDMTNVVDFPSNSEEIFNELSENLEIFKNGYNKSSNIVPKELNNDKNLISYYFNYIDKFYDQSFLDTFKTHEEFDRFVIEKFDCRNWQNLLSPRITDTWFNKSLDTCKWLENETTPKFKAWVESLRENIFDQIGRIIVFNSKVDKPVMMHRDYHFRPHTSHFINFQFSGKTNVAYVYDEVKKEKIYIDTPCYMFNETDLHGVDACSTPRFTVRIDGVFKPHICESLNLSGSNVWDYCCASAYKIQNIKIIEPTFYDA
jgi:hypothetical protein